MAIHRQTGLENEGFWSKVNLAKIDTICTDSLIYLAKIILCVKSIPLTQYKYSAGFSKVITNFIQYQPGRYPHNIFQALALALCESPGHAIFLRSSISIEAEATRASTFACLLWWLYCCWDELDDF